MKSEQDRPVARVHYEKPTAVDLGPAAPVVGASCGDGQLISVDQCQDVGNSATSGNCVLLGMSAGLVCSLGGGAVGVCAPDGSEPGAE